MTTTSTKTISGDIPDVNSKPRLRISLAPLTKVNAFTDVEGGVVYLSQYKYCAGQFSDIVADEIAHFISGPDHDESWERACLDSYGKIPEHNKDFDRLRRRLGIPCNIAGNIGNITGIQQILTDYHLLQSYRRFSQRILGNEGHWEVLGNNKIRLYPTPKGSFPVVCLYIPFIDTWRTPANKLLAMDMLLAETMIMLGNARGKFSGIPSPDGGSLSFDGTDLRQKGYELRDKIMQDAMLLSDDPQASAIYRW